MSLKCVVVFLAIVAFCSTLFSEDKELIVVILSYNNERYCEQNLKSVFIQTYRNYRVIFVDDCSKDRTGELASCLIEKNDFKNKFTFLKNKFRKKAVQNFYEVIHGCPDNAVIVVLDGDDWFASDTILEEINTAYQDENVWMTYGNYRCIVGKKLYCGEFSEETILNNTYRKHSWVSSHVRTFYAWLFKQIKKEDLMYKGEFFPLMSDYATMLPMLELAGGRYKFINKPLYIYNNCNRLNNNRVNKKNQLFFKDYILEKEPYLPLQEVIINPNNQKAKEFEPKKEVAKSSRKRNFSRRSSYMKKQSFGLNK